MGKKKTLVVKKTLNPVYNEILRVSITLDWENPKWWPMCVSSHIFLNTVPLQIKSVAQRGEGKDQHFPRNCFVRDDMP